MFSDRVQPFLRYVQKLFSKDSDSFQQRFRQFSVKIQAVFSKGSGIFSWSSGLHCSAKVQTVFRYIQKGFSLFSVTGQLKFRQFSALFKKSSADPQIFFCKDSETNIILRLSTPTDTVLNVSDTETGRKTRCLYCPLLKASATTSKNYKQLVTAFSNIMFKDL